MMGSMVAALGGAGVDACAASTTRELGFRFLHNSIFCFIVITTVLN